MKTKKKAVGIMIAAAAAIALIICLSVSRQYSENKNLQYSQEYIPGTGNIRGDVDTERFTEVSDAFAIGANRYGYAVFKDPDAAWRELKSRYADGICLIQEEFDLAPLSESTYEAYEEYGWQVTSGSREERDEAAFVSGFLDIYENSFKKQ